MNDTEQYNRLIDSELRLKTIHKIRFALLQIAHDVKGENHQIYDDEFYVEANEILNEIEKRVWEYIDDKIDKY